MHRTTGTRTGKLMAAAVAAFAATALVAAACGGGTSSKDKTATAAAKGGTTPAAAATKPAAAATTSATKASGTTPAASTSPAAGDTTLKVATDATLGKFLTDGKGITLYTFTKDTAGNGKSACSGGCASAWPALIGSAPTAKPAGVTGDFATITRDDGTKQVTYKGMPLYYFASDKAPGDTKGQGVGGVWAVAAP